MPTFDELVGQLSDRLSRSGQEEGESQGSSSSFFRRLETGTSAAGARPIAVDSFNNLSWRYMDETEYPFLRQRDYRAFESVIDRYASGLGLSTRRTREERTTMNIAIKLPELTEQEKSKLLTFYKNVLQNGYATWPLRDGQMALWIDGRVRRIQTYSEWLLATDVLYIGYSSDGGQDNVSDPAVRLAIVTALMALTGHACDQTLMELVERRLATIMAGNYQTAVAPLGQRADGRPIEQMAWSTRDGLAARLGEEWVRPLTGEPVEVGAGWVVLDLPKQEAAPVVEEVSPSSPQAEGRTLQEFAEDQGYMTRWLIDGRLAISFGNESSAYNVYQAAINFGCQNLVVIAYDMGWFVTTALQSEIPM